MREEGLKFYRSQAEKWGLDLRSSVPDSFVRAKEVEAILATLRAITKEHRSNSLNILEVGCGNGTLLAELQKAGYKKVTAIDTLPEFVGLARSRGTGYNVRQGDIRHLDFPDESFDVVISERVVINLPTQAEQALAFSEMNRVLAFRGYLVLIEAYVDAWHNLNAARLEFDLDPLPMATHNRWLEEAELDKCTRDFVQVKEIGDTSLAPRNFLSSYYYASRVLHDVLLRASNKEQGVKESLFARFAGEALPPVGNYANIQFLCFRKD